jgi:peptidoglycan/LPS O-acetylase OafA/YrhL
VLLVIAYHAAPAALVGGYLGVDVFFVISGFLITGLLLRERTATGRIRLGRFWARRARRLLPALILLLVIVSFVAALIGGDLVPRLPGQLLGAATFSSNWVAVATGADYIQLTTPDLYRNLWSLAVEEQFYLLWPLAMLALALVPSRAVRVLAVAALAAASALAMALVPGDPSRLYFGTDTHAFGLAMGAALAIGLSGRFAEDAHAGDPDSTSVSGRLLPPPGARRPHRVVLALIDLAGLAALVGVIVIGGSLAWTDPRTLGGGLALASALTVVVIAAATTPGSWFGRALDVPPLRWVGERSYGLYLWHWPVLVIVGVLVGEHVGRDAPWWLVPVIAIPIAVVAAVLSYRFVETPIRRFGVRGAIDRLELRPRAIRVTAWALILAAFIASLLTSSLIVTDDGRSDAQAAIERGEDAIATLEAAVATDLPGAPTPAAASPTPPPGAGAVPPSTPRSGMRPPPPPVASGPEISAIGDSVMLASAPELAAAFPGIAIDATVSRHMSSALDLVAQQLAAGTLRPVVVLGLGTNGGFDPATLAAIVDAIGPDRQLVLVSAQAPRDWIPDNNQAMRDFALRMRVVELADWYTAIQPRLDVLASDDVHPGPTGAAIYTQAVRDALERLTLVPPLVGDDELRWLPRPL